ncbi:MAG: hypothetical protein U0Q16_09190 [Bryobacteraceae bacterium]
MTTPRGLPVPGAMVTFRTPRDGPGGQFGCCGSLTVVTDTGGFAVAHGMKPNTAPGSWTMEVWAEGPGWRVLERVDQTNAVPLSLSEPAGRAVSELDLGVGLAGVLSAFGAGLLFRQLCRQPWALRRGRHRGKAPAIKVHDPAVVAG